MNVEDLRPRGRALRDRRLHRSGSDLLIGHEPLGGHDGLGRGAVEEPIAEPRPDVLSEPVAIRARDVEEGDIGS